MAVAINTAESERALAKAATLPPASLAKLKNEYMSLVSLIEMLCET
ncbi:MAG: hypothetical protein AAGK17_07305 [Pseudomonadota bacterium]